MATKRPHSDVDQAQQEPSHRPREKKMKYNKHELPKVQHYEAVKARADKLLQKLANGTDMPAHVRVAKERELQSVQFDLDRARVAVEKSMLIGRWHKVRFMERKRSDKGLKRSQKALAALSESASRQEKEDAETEVHNYEVDLNYALSFPLDKNYVAIYPKKAANADSDAATATTPTATRGDPDIRRLVEECMRNGTLDKLRNGKLTTSDVGRYQGVSEDGQATYVPGSAAGKFEPKAIKKSSYAGVPKHVDRKQGGFKPGAHGTYKSAKKHGTDDDANAGSEHDGAGMNAARAEYSRFESSDRDASYHEHGNSNGSGKYSRPSDATERYEKKNGRYDRQARDERHRFSSKAEDDEGSDDGFFE